MWPSIRNEALLQTLQLPASRHDTVMGACMSALALIWENLVQEMAADVHCIVEAMVGRESDVALLPPFVDNVPPCIIGDRDRLRGILLNLYTNAAKFTRRGALALHIAVTGPNYEPAPHEHDNLVSQSLPAGDFNSVSLPVC